MKKSERIFLLRHGLHPEALILKILRYLKFCENLESPLITDLDETSLEESSFQRGI